MLNKLSIVIFHLIILCKSVSSFAQELPPILNYSPATYAAGNQNWSIAQDKQHFIYFANNEGLLQYNGANWNLFKSPNETIIRSVKVINNKVYTGCYMEFGYWIKLNDGQLKYTSLSTKIKSKILDEEQFWNIIDYDHWVIFQSLNRIYIYDTKKESFAIITPKSNIVKSYKTANAIYYQTINDGLFEIENGKSKQISVHPNLKKNRIIDVYNHNDGLLLVTQNSGLFNLKSGNLSTYFTNSVIESSSIYCSQMLATGEMVLGTVSNGVFIITKDGKTKYHITQGCGLRNNTVLSLFEDSDQNLWIGLDNGINCINLQSAVRSFSDDTGTIGTVYAATVYQDNLYLGTNQGLFYKSYNSKESFKFIQGTKGQVWSLFKNNETLFCGHDSGTFVINQSNAKLIYSGSGTWKFSQVPNQPNKIIQGNYNGLSVLEKTSNQWNFKNKISGFTYSARYFEITTSLETYISHEYKAIYRLQIDQNLQQAKNVFAYKNPTKGKNASLATYNNTIYYASKNGVYKLNSSSKQFEKDNLISAVFTNNEYTSGKIIVDDSNKIWLFSKNYIHYFSLSKLGSQLKQNTIPIPASLTNSLTGFENINQISKSTYLIGTSNGYYTINIDDLSFKNYKVSITNVSNNKTNNQLYNYPFDVDGTFKYDENNITISYTIPEYNKYINAEYQYFLEGFEQNWSEWGQKPFVGFKNLPSGKYIFKVRAKVANSQPENIAQYSFTISKPWYRTNFALILYVLAALCLGYYINKAYEKYYSKQKQKLIDENNLLLEIKELENEQQLMKVRNEQLSIDVDTKSRELAVSTMSLIKKDELLLVIKEDLKKTSDEASSRSIKSVITTITKNITNDNTWNVFKDAFDTADKDFLKKVKQTHASLTPNDLRLCAYLRLNLSSKEIAPLLNISVRSIEIKRYRLRKKMELPHETGLVEYILSI